MMEKDANVSYPKTKCDLCDQPALTVINEKAYCKECQELQKQAELKTHDVYHIPRSSN